MRRPVLFTIASRLGGGGIGTIAYHEALGLLRAGLLGRVLCLGALPGEIPREILSPVRFLPRGALGFLSDRWYYWAKNRWFDRAARREVDGFARLHAWSAQCPDAVSAAWRRGMPIVLHRASTHVLTQCEILAREYERAGLRPVLPLGRVVESSLKEYEQATRIVVPSEFARRSFTDRGVPAEKLAVNPFGVDADHFCPAPRARGQGLRLLFVGEVGVRKGVPRLLAIFDRLAIPGVVLDLAGAVKDEMAPLLTRYRGRRDVVFHGHVADIRPLLARADLFVFPTAEDGFGLVLLEAMAAGLPVVTSDRQGVVTESGPGRVVVPLDDVDGWVAAIRRFAEDAELREAEGRAARAFAEGFTWAAFGDRAAALHCETGS